MLTLMQKNVVFFKTVSRGGRRPRARRHPHDAHRRRGRARLDPRNAPTAPTSSSPRAAVTVHRRPPRHRADAVQGLRAGRRRRPLERRHVRVRPAPHQARLRLRAADERVKATARRIRSARDVRAQLGYGDARDRDRGRGARRRDARRRASRLHRPALLGSAGATCSSCCSRRSARSSSWSRRCSRTTSRSRTSPTTSRARRPASTRSPRRGARSRARSCCGRSRSRSTSAFTTWRFRERADDPLVAWATLVQLVVLVLLLRADAVPGEPVQA